MRDDQTSSRRAVVTTWALALALLAPACSDDTTEEGTDAGPDVSIVDANPGVDSAAPDTGPTPQDAGVDSGDDADLVVEDAGADAAPDADPVEEDTGPIDPDAFTLTAIVPPTGPVEGGSRVRISGEGLVEGTRVFLGSALMDVVPGGAGLVGDTPPALGSGPVTVKAIHPDGRVVALPDGFTYTNGLQIGRASCRERV